MTGYYISGPMTGKGFFNYPAFFEAERRLIDGNPFGTIFNPARNDCERCNLHVSQVGFVHDYEAESLALAVTAKDKATRREMLATDLAWIMEHCDVIVVLEGWEGSSGARAEVAAATAVGASVKKFVTGVLTGTPFLVEIEADSSRALGNLTVAKPVVITGTAEVRQTATSGGQKGSKLAAYDQISPEVLHLLAEHFGKGAQKYAPHNFRKQYPWSLSFSALMRHAWAAWGGEDYDNHLSDCPADCVEHTGSLHWVAAIWHAMNLAELTLHKDQHPEYDDRFTYEVNEPGRFGSHEFRKPLDHNERGEIEGLD